MRAPWRGDSCGHEGGGAIIINSSRRRRGVEGGGRRYVGAQTNSGGDVRVKINNGDTRNQPNSHLIPRPVYCLPPPATLLPHRPPIQPRTSPKQQHTAMP